MLSRTASHPDFLLQPVFEPLYPFCPAFKEEGNLSSTSPLLPISQNAGASDWLVGRHLAGLIRSGTDFPFSCIAGNYVMGPEELQVSGFLWQQLHR